MALSVAASNKNEKSLKVSIKPSSVSKAFVAGALSGTISTVLFQPLDLIKTRVQLQASSAQQSLIKGGADAICVRSHGIVQITYNIIRTDGTFGLWRGMTPTLYRTVPGVGVYFSILQYLKGFVGETPSFYENLCLGFASRSMAGVALLPATVIKARFESGHFNYTSVFGAFQTIWRTEGLRGLFSGCTATIARDAPFSGLYLMFYSQGKSILAAVLDERQLGANDLFVCGVGSGLLASAVTQPADVIKTQMQLYPSYYNNTVDCLAKVIKKHGPVGLFRGMIPRCMRRTLMSAMAWTVFESLMKKLDLK